MWTHTELRGRENQRINNRGEVLQTSRIVTVRKYQLAIVSHV